MADHVAILMKRYLDRVLAGHKTVESRLTKTARAPFGMIEPGDRIYFKCSGGPYMAAARAGRVEFYEGLTPAKIGALRRKYERTVGDDDAYWQWKRDSRYATFIELSDVQPTETGPLLPPSRGIAWFVCQPEPLPQRWQVTLTGGALRNGYVRIPAEAADAGTPAGQPIELAMPDGSTVRSELRGDRLIRWRGWRPHFQRHQLQAGDRIGFERLAPWRYRVAFNRGDSIPGRQSPTHSPSSGGACTARSHARDSRHTPPTSADPKLDDYISARRLDQLIRQAKAEDLGPPRRDITTDCLIPADATAGAVVRSREAGVVAGAILLGPIARCYDPDLGVNAAAHDGQQLAPGDVVAELAGPLRSILTAERVALNFLTHLSGIATLTAQYVQAVAGTRAGIYDTRKTLPGLRGLEKYAVACGGGHSHRIGLYDAVLVKDNHIAHVAARDLPAALNQAIVAARACKPPPDFVQVEVDTLAQFKRVLTCPVDLVLLDNMDTEQMTRAVALRDKRAPHVQLEASGGVTLTSVADIARTGVDRISVGALTHSAPALDLGLDILKCP